MGWTLTEAGIDWITVTAPTGPKATNLFDVGVSIISQEKQRGNDGRTTNFEGYHGTASKHAFAGWRLDGACIRLGGGVARARWRDVARAASNCSRLDLAVTAIGSPPDRTVASRYWNELPTRPKRNGRPTEYSLIQSRGGGETLYCGRRASEYFGRIYDKYRESKGVHPEGSWRFEIEYKGEAAKQLAAYLLAQTSTEQAVTMIVGKRFAEWDVSVPFEVPEWLWQETPVPNPTSNETRMKWLREQVRLSVETLSTSYTADELRVALGLQFGADAARNPAGRGADIPPRRYEVRALAQSTLNEVNSDVGDGPRTERDGSTPNGAGSAFEYRGAGGELPVVAAPTDDPDGRERQCDEVDDD